MSRGKTIRFSKIKYDGKRVELHWTEKSLQAETDHVLKASGSPTPRFRQAIDRFIPIVIDLLDLPSSWKDKLRVTGLSINEEEGDGRDGLVITSMKSVEQANSPLVLNTPHLRQPVKDGEFSQPGFFVEGMSEAIKDARAQATAYLNGDREQRELFVEDKAGGTSAETRAQMALVE